MNRVPEKDVLAFLDLVGVERSPGVPAEAPITFVLSSRSEGQQIPAGTQVATTQSEAANARVFETRTAFFATPAQLTKVINLLPAEESVRGAAAVAAAADARGPCRSVLLPAILEVLSAGASGPGLVDHTLYLASAVVFGRKD